MEYADLACDARLIHRRTYGTVPAGDSLVVRHRRGAISQEGQQVGECFLNGKVRPGVAAGLLQHLEGAAIVLHGFFGGIHDMCGIAGLDQRTHRAVGIGETAGTVEMMRDP